MMEITAEIRALIDKAAAGVELAGDEYIDPADGLIPVSYTHLDVYKRQDGRHAAPHDGGGGRYRGTESP